MPDILIYFYHGMRWMSSIWFLYNNHSNESAKKIDPGCTEIKRWSSSGSHALAWPTMKRHPVPLQRDRGVNYIYEINAKTCRKKIEAIRKGIRMVRWEREQFTRCLTNGVRLSSALLSRLWSPLSSLTERIVRIFASAPANAPVESDDCIQHDNKDDNCYTKIWHIPPGSDFTQRFFWILQPIYTIYSIPYRAYRRALALVNHASHNIDINRYRPLPWTDGFVCDNALPVDDIRLR